MTTKTMPHRVQRKRTKGWKMPPNTVYVGRPTAYGNPYFVGHNADSPKQAVDFYRKDTVTKLDESQLEKLRGKNLSCWCSLDKPCHADVLLEKANVRY